MDSPVFIDGCQGSGRPPILYRNVSAETLGYPDVGREDRRPTFRADGQQAARAVLDSMQEQLTKTQDQLHKATERAAVAEKEVNDILDFHPFLRNWRANLAEMRKAGMSLRKIQEVFRRGSSDDVDVPVFRHGNRTYTERARVVLSPSTKGGMFAWFNKMRFQKFLSIASDSIREKEKHQKD